VFQTKVNKIHIHDMQSFLFLLSVVFDKIDKVYKFEFSANVCISADLYETE
jgi:hypothetical protein